MSNERPFDPNKPYTRRDGKAAKIVHTLRKIDGMNYLVVYEAGSNHEWYYSVDGLGYYSGINRPCEYDLINTPVKHKVERWGVYTQHNTGPTSCYGVYGGREYAEHVADSLRPARDMVRVHVVCLEGEYEE